MEAQIDKEPKPLSDYFRVILKGIFDPLAAFLNRIGLKPNTVTALGLIGHICAGYLLATGKLTWGGIVILLVAPIDALDGTMARLRGEPSKFGAFVDSVTDRYDELVIFGGLLVYFLREENWLACILVYAAISGSVLVSYVRSRAETLGFNARIGILSRFERYVVLVPALVFKYPIVAMWILAIFTHLTALQRIIHVRKQARILENKTDF